MTCELPFLAADDARNALTYRGKTTTWRRNARRSIVFGNALGNAAIAGIEQANAASEQKQLRASVDQLQATQSAELGASTNAFEAQTGQMASDYINARAQTTLDQEYAGTEQALEGRLAAMPDPSLAASIAAVNGSLPQGTVTVEPLQIIEEGGRYGNAAQQREANFEAMNAYIDSVSVDPAETARVNAARAQQYATDVANQRAFEAWQAQDQKDLLAFYPKVIAGGVESLVNSVAALPQQIWNGMKMYGAADLDYAAASASLAGNNTASVQLSDAADADRAAALQPVWVPFQNLSPEEQFGGDVAMVAGLFTGYGEAEISEFGSVARGADALDGLGGASAPAIRGVDGINLNANPDGITVSTTVFRFQEPDRVETAWDVGSWNILSDHRYSGIGQGAIYGATDPDTAFAEVDFWTGQAGSRVQVQQYANVDNVLNLTDPIVRQQLNVTLDQITSDSYIYTHQIANFARSNGYNGILAPSARLPGGRNLVIFSGDHP